MCWKDPATYANYVVGYPNWKEGRTCSPKCCQSSPTSITQVFGTAQYSTSGSRPLSCLARPQPCGARKSCGIPQRVLPIQQGLAPHICWGRPLRRPASEGCCLVARYLKIPKRAVLASEVWAETVSGLYWGNSHSQTTQGEI